MRAETYKALLAQAKIDSLEKRWIKLRIEVDDNDSTMCCNCRYRHFGLDCKHVSRCPACLDADITDKLDRLAELEKQISELLTPNLSARFKELYELRGKRNELEKRNRVLERAIEILKEICYEHTTLGESTIDILCNQALEHAQKEIESEI